MAAAIAADTATSSGASAERARRRITIHATATMKPTQAQAHTRAVVEEKMTAKTAPTASSWPAASSSTRWSS